MDQLLGLVAVLVAAAPLMALARWLEARRAPTSTKASAVAATGPTLDLGRVFEPFYTTKGPVESAYGQGLGLTIARRLLQRLTPLEEALGQPNVLLVEEDPGTRDVLRDALGRAGYRIQEAASRAEASHLLDVRPTPDAIILDIEMPKATGQDVVDSLLRAAPSVPVLALSAATRPSVGPTPTNRPATFVAHAILHQLVQALRQMSSESTGSEPSRKE